MKGLWSNWYDAGMACRQPGFDSRRVHSVEERAVVAGTGTEQRPADWVRPAPRPSPALNPTYGREPDTVGRAAVLTRLPERA